METKLRIVKIGGNLLDHPQKLNIFLEDFADLPHPKILVHGGGKTATAISKNLGIESIMIGGRRITSSEDLKVIIMVYAGLINKKLIAQLQALQCNAIGLSGADANCISANLRPKEPLDYGWVGDIKKINTDMIQNLLEIKLTPVFCALSHDNQGHLLNTNADTIAAEIAIALSDIYEVELTYCFEKPGVLQDVNDDNSLILNIDTVLYNRLKANKTIQEGMLPKLENCFHALQKGVSKVVIGNAESIRPHQHLFTTVNL